VNRTELKHSAGLGFRVTSLSLDRLFEDAALALMQQIVDTHQILRKDSQKIVLSAPTRSDLLLTWLSELVSQFDDQQFLVGEAVRRFAHATDGQWCLNASVSGETVDSHRHQIRSHVKAIRLAQIKLVADTDGDEWLAEVNIDS